MTRIRTLALGLIAAPLALALSGCGKSDETGDKPSGAPIAKIAAPAGKAWVDTVSITPDGGYLMGNPDAPIKLVEFGSLTCSHCAEFAEKSGAELRDPFVSSGRVSYEFRNFVRDAIDVTAARLTRCGSPESFFALTDQVFANQTAMFQTVQKAGDAAFQSAMNLPDDKRGPAIAQLTGLTDFFAARGISKEQAATCLADAAAMQDLAKRTEKAGNDYDITGTPTFVVNGKKLDVNTWPELKARLENLGAR